VQYQIGFFVPVPPTDVVACLGPSSPSSFAPAAPGYLDCSGGLSPFGVAENGQGVYPDGCLVMNATNDAPIATETKSFGAIKARY
jgi:hypothetical protein